MRNLIPHKPPLLRLFGMRIDDDMADVTEEEIISMVNEGHEQGVLLATEAEMITNIFEFGDKEAHDIMTHRNHVVAVGGNMPLKEAVASEYLPSPTIRKFVHIRPQQSPFGSW